MASARTRDAAARNCAVSDPEGPPKALQASECDELLDHTRASCMILAQRQPGKFILQVNDEHLVVNRCLVLCISTVNVRGAPMRARV